ncbi:hypothetical protein DLAC_01147 [Tieghemostelium lacteum]|uniref:Uncharacterized protein n=1 Tax=Tieghemostelium lacteum TaxID=361077 RepID=A0A152A861_TIELA|nr:hypothetical protein DLAC_01147 [Tieghemostelium lacteum]|eukprot:KYR02315.1 hypothetical protein DLAC_01147 [Tieghemostelium lacteum]
MLSRYIFKNQTKSLGIGAFRMYSSNGFIKSNEEMVKLKKQGDLSDEKVNEIIRQAEDQRELQYSTAVSNDMEPQQNINKANKKIKKMVPKDIEKFD